ncbi:MAG: SufS family cysteine desulfurase, partial [Deltaproteobacteria bacterium]|nr:SufS family cysteine desulfurase [Deltaproteobacteria bacterium]
SQFPILKQQVHGKQLVYLDSAATSLKPLSVVEAERAYELEYSANVHRGVHALSERATKAYEGTRDQLKDWLNANSRKEIIFTSGTTEGINLVAHSWGRKFLKPSDEIWISSLEHHSNIVPWQILCEEIGCVLKVISLNHQGEIPFGKQAKLLAFSYASNAIGQMNPTEDWIKQAKAAGVTTLLDAAQAAPHVRLDVQKLDADFVVFSAHKAYGPTGVGMLYGKEQILDSINPYQAGGDMIEQVTFEKTTYAPLPAKLEAGTPNIAGVIGLGAAINWLREIDLEKVAAHESKLAKLIRQEFKKIPGISLVLEDDATPMMPVVSWTMKGAHPHDIASILDREGIAVRAGHLCAQPLLKLLGLTALTRASLAAYNTEQDVEALISSIGRVKQVLRC